MWNRSPSRTGTTSGSSWIFVLVLTSALAFAGDQRRGTIPAEVSASGEHRDDDLRKEFAGAYPRNAPESTAVRSWSIVASPAEVKVFNGHTLAVWAYNGVIPGPTLRIRLGETVRVEFINHLPQPSTIHWHGVRVPNNMDGVPGVTQPAVPPGGSFLYEFTPKDAGTFWFHPHVRSSEQVERGLYGVLIVDDTEPLPYSRDVLWVLDDWRITPEGPLRQLICPTAPDAHSRLVLQAAQSQRGAGPRALLA